MIAERHDNFTEVATLLDNIAPDYGYACDNKLKPHVPHLRYINCTPRSLLYASGVQLMFKEDQTFTCCLTCTVHLLLFLA